MASRCVTFKQGMSWACQPKIKPKELTNRQSFFKSLTQPKANNRDGGHLKCDRDRLRENY